MLKRCSHILILAVLLISNIQSAVAQQRNSLSISRDRMALQIDLKSGKKALDSIFNIAGIGSQGIDKVMQGDLSPFVIDGWNLVSRQDNILRLEKSLDVLNKNPQDNPYDITMHLPQIKGRPGYPGAIKYGVNRFAKVTVIELASGMTRFILPDHNQARRVFLSGSFNDWSTLKGLMLKTDGGWVIDIKLKPGAYEYKYIVDGGWITDPNNYLRTSDGGGNTNSVYYKYNHTFKLKGHAAAHRVMLAGDFNNWNSNELVMTNNNGVWEEQLYLSEGIFAYKFLVDGNWITDPANSITEKDDSGNINSILKLGETVNFKLSGYSNAQKVFIAGNFNNWKPEELAMMKTPDGWKTRLVLGAGNYQYKFIVDGKWITDLDNPNTAVEGGKTNSLISVKPNYTFRLKGYANARSIKLAGTFNNWDQNSLSLKHEGNEWMISLYLRPGKYLYKFIVDGQWISDSANKLWENKDFHNSVLWIEQ